MIQKLRNRLSYSRNQLLIIYAIQVTCLFAVCPGLGLFMISTWQNESTVLTSFTYTQYTIRRDFENAYWQTDLAISLIQGILNDDSNLYKQIPLCNGSDCFVIQSRNPDLDFQFSEVNVYEGAIYNSTGNSKFGNLGSFLWQFKYSCSSVVESLEILLSSSNQQDNLQIHIPVEIDPKPHIYQLTGKENCSFSTEGIVFSKSFNLSSNNASISGIVSSKIQITRLMGHLSAFPVRLAQKNSGQVYIDTLSPNAKTFSKQLSITVGTIQIDLVISQELNQLFAVYALYSFWLYFLLLLSAIPIYYNVKSFYKKYTNPIDSINNTLKDKLKNNFNGNQSHPHRQIGIHEEVNNLWRRCEEIPGYVIHKQELEHKSRNRIELKFLSKFTEIHQMFCRKTRAQQYKHIYNNKHIVTINEDFEKERVIIKSVRNLVKAEDFFQCAYLAACGSDENKYLKMLAGVNQKYELNHGQSSIFFKFFYRFRSKDFHDWCMESKVREASIHSGQFRNIRDNGMYFGGMSLDQPQIAEKIRGGTFDKAFFQKAFFQRTKNIVIAKYLILVKEEDKNLKYLRDLGVQLEIREIEQDVDNFRYQMSKKQSSHQQTK